MQTFEYPQAVMLPRRVPRTAEAFQVRCWRCFTDQELPADRLRFYCRKCGTHLQIEWRSPIRMPGRKIR
jgi:Zn finger protein HypA/HybF involved in hydrogenase expression